MKKIITVFMFIFLLFINMQVVCADSYIVVSNENELLSALRSNENNEIIMNNDITLSENTLLEITSGEHTLNLQNYTLSTERNADRVGRGLITVMGGTLIINSDSDGVLESPGIEETIIVSSGKLIINGGNIKNPVLRRGPGSVLNNGGDVYLNDGNYVGRVVLYGGNLVINNGTFDGYSDSALWISGSDLSAKIKQGSFKAGDNLWSYGINSAIHYSGGSASIGNYQNILDPFIVENSVVDNPTIYEYFKDGFYYYGFGYQVVITNNERVVYSNKDDIDVVTSSVINIIGDYNKFVSVTMGNEVLKKYVDYKIRGTERQVTVTLSEDFMDMYGSNPIFLKVNFTDGFLEETIDLNATVEELDSDIDTNANMNTNTNTNTTPSTDGVKNPYTGFNNIILILKIMFFVISIIGIFLNYRKICKRKGKV